MLKLENNEGALIIMVFYTLRIPSQSSVIVNR